MNDTARSNSSVRLPAEAVFRFVKVPASGAMRSPTEVIESLGQGVRVTSLPEYAHAEDVVIEGVVIMGLGVSGGFR